MRPAFTLYAEYLDGANPRKLARKWGLPRERVVFRLRAARWCLALPNPMLLPEEALRFGRHAAA
jgi:hypothetical protein